MVALKLARPLTATYENENGGGRVTLPAGHLIELDPVITTLEITVYSEYGIAVVADEAEIAAALEVN